MAEDHKEAPSNTPPVSESVGYCRPPRKHRFKKGVSGNPKGRPSKPKTGPQSIIQNRFEDMVREELLRPITIRENNVSLEMPCGQAAIRKLMYEATKGRIGAMNKVADLTMVEAQRDRTSNEIMIKNYHKWKKRWADECEAADTLGIPRPNPVPHPDDFQFDARTQVFNVNGPVDERDKARWDVIVARTVQLEEKLRKLHNKKRRTRLSDESERELDRATNQLLFLQINFPPETIRREIGFDLALWRQETEANLSKVSPSFKEYCRSVRDGKELFI